jgi:hypothetical protein
MFLFLNLGIPWNMQFGASTYYYATDACSRNQTFPIEIMYGGSIYEIKLKHSQASDNRR